MSHSCFMPSHSARAAATSPASSASIARSIVGRDSSLSSPSLNHLSGTAPSSRRRARTISAASPSGAKQLGGGHAAAPEDLDLVTRAAGHDVVRLAAQPLLENQHRGDAERDGDEKDD